jgi:hypothetical protein
VCGSGATELEHAEGLQETGFHTWPTPRRDVVSRPEELLGDHWTSATSEWGNVEEVFRGTRDILRAGSGLRLGSFEMQFAMSTFRFWNQVTDTATGDWRRSAEQVVGRWFDAVQFPAAPQGHSTPGNTTQCLGWWQWRKKQSRGRKQYTGLRRAPNCVCVPRTLPWRTQRAACWRRSAGSHGPELTGL